MDKIKTGNALKKMAGDVVASEGSMESSEIWVSPKHWKAMTDDKRAVVVDMYHRSDSYSKKFPFHNMTSPSDSYSVGITFNINGDGDLNSETKLELFKELKIPHLLGTYDEVRKAKEKLLPKQVDL